MEKLIKKAHTKDIALIIACIALIWSTLLFNLYQISRLTMDAAVFRTIAVACILCLIFLTSALIGVITHLKKNKDHLYQQEFIGQQLFNGDQGGE